MTSRRAHGKPAARVREYIARGGQRFRRPEMQTMHEQELTNRQIVDAHAAATTLASALRPGLFAFRVGEIKAALAPQAEHVETQRAEMLRDAAKKDEHGNPVTQDAGAGRVLVLFDTPAAQKAFAERERDLYAATSLVRAPRLKVSDLPKIDSERRANADVSVDFDALMPFVVDDTAGSTNGTNGDAPAPPPSV